MNKISVLLLLMISVGCSVDAPKRFSEKALQDKVITLHNDTVTFNKVLEKHQGKKIMLEVWASWCGDCIEGMPKVKELQKEFPDVVFLFVSLDKSLEDLKAGIDRYNVTGEHYFLPSEWKGDLGTFLGLDWIPRYMVLDERGQIVLFKAVKSDDSRIIDALKK